MISGKKKNKTCHNHHELAYPSVRGLLVGVVCLENCSKQGRQWLRCLYINHICTLRPTQPPAPNHIPWRGDTLEDWYPTASMSSDPSVILSSLIWQEGSFSKVATRTSYILQSEPSAWTLHNWEGGGARVGFRKAGSNQLTEDWTSSQAPSLAVHYAWQKQYELRSSV